MHSGKEYSSLHPLRVNCLKDESQGKSVKLKIGGNSLMSLSDISRESNARAFFKLAKASIK